MSANKTLVALLTAALALPTLAAGQTTVPVISTGPDLVPLKIDIVSAVVGVPTDITATIANQGNAACCGSGGWQVVFSKAPDSQTCFADAGTPLTGSKCVVRVTTPNADANLAPGHTANVKLSGWTPTADDVAPGSPTFKVYVWVTPVGCDPTTRGNPVCGFSATPDPGHYNGPDTPNEVNDVQSFPVTIKNPAVRAEPVRTTSPTPSAKPNDPYQFSEITTACAEAPDTNLVGCRAHPGHLYRFSYKVVNAGNAQDTFLARVVDNQGGAGSPNLTDRHYTWSFAPWHVTIPDHSSAVVNLEVVVPASEYLNNRTNINGTASSAIHVEWASEANPAVKTDHPTDVACGPQLQAQELCADPTWPSFLVDAHRGLNLTSNETLRQANYTTTGQRVTFNATVNNSGNAWDRFLITMDNSTSQVNGSWQGDVPAYVDVSPFGNTTFQMAFTPPRNATKGYHNFDVTLASVNDSTARATLHFVADLTQWYGIHGALNANVIQVVPNEPANYVLFVHNDGNGPDNVTIDMKNEPFGWKVQPSTRTILLGPDDTGTAYLNVTPPMNTAAGTASSTFLNVTSQGDPILCPFPCSTIVNNATVNVISGPNLDVTTPTPKAFVDPGTTTSYDVAVRNTGNVVDNFTVTIQRSQDQLAWTTTYDPAYLVLSPTATGTVHVTLKAPSSGAVGETTKVFVTVNSSVNVARFRQVTLEGEVSGPDLFVESVATNGTNPYSGDPLELNVILGNAGNKAPDKNVTLKVYFVQNGVPRPIADHTYTPSELPGGRRLTERIVWDTTSIDGTGVLLARIDEDKAIPEIDETNNEASRALVLRTFNFHVTAAEPLSAHPGEKLSYNAAPHAFTIRYDGNQATENVTAIIESEHGWGHHEEGFQLAKGATVPVFVDLTIPDQPGVPTDVLTLRVIPALRQNAAITAQTTTTVIDENAPKILSVAATPSVVKIGEAVTIRADVTDETGLQSVRAILITPANETQVVNLEKGAGNSYSHTQPFSLAGTFRLYIEAVDGSVNANKNSSRDTVVSFSVNPGSAPVIKLAEGQVTTVKTGVPVRLNITDPLGVGDVTYTIRGVTAALQRPFSIETAELKEGSYDITVTAANVYGVRSSAKIQLTIDNTPPVIHGVTLNPSSPKANQDATLHVDTDASAENVTITIKKGDQIVDTRSAIKKSAGTFELAFNPAEGSYSIDVSAKDAAGNEQLSKGAVTFTAKPAGVPGPELGLLLAGLAAVALLVGRRRKA